MQRQDCLQAKFLEDSEFYESLVGANLWGWNISADMY